MSEDKTKSETEMKKKAKQFIGENTILVSQDELEEILEENKPKVDVSPSEKPDEKTPKKKGFLGGFFDDLLDDLE